MDFEQLLNNVVNWLTTEGLKIVIGLVVLYIAFKAINIISRKIEKGMRKKEVDLTISTVVMSTLRKVLKVLAIICFIGYIGIETSSIAAAITSAGVAIGLALQGSLANFAGGVVILVMHPYKIGDYVMIGGEEGTVEKIELFYTYLTTTDNKVIVIPNANASNETIINYCKHDTRRVDIVFQIAYENDFEKAKRIIVDCAESTGYLLPDVPVFARVSAHNSSSIDIKAKMWVKTENYWPLYHDMLEKVKTEFDKEGISIPYQQIDVQIKK